MIISPIWIWWFCVSISYCVLNFCGFIICTKRCYTNNESNEPNEERNASCTSIFRSKGIASMHAISTIGQRWRNFCENFFLFSWLCKIEMKTIGWISCLLSISLYTKFVLNEIDLIGFMWYIRPSLIDFSEGKRTSCIRS